MTPDDFLHGGLVEDEDGAPYPEHVQAIVRTLAGEVEQLREVVEQHHADFCAIDKLLSDAFTDVAHDIAKSDLQADRYEGALRDIRKIVRPR